MNPILNTNELQSLSREINSREETIGTIRNKVKETLYLAGPEILLQGQALLRAKAMVPHGMWMTWLKVNCPLVSERNAQRYMARAANPTLSDFYHLLCDAEEKTSGAKESREWPGYLEALGRASKFFGYVQRFPLDKWPEEGRAKLKTEMEPLAKALWPERFSA